MKILVTGSNGQLGSDIKHVALNHVTWDFYFTDLPDLDLTDRDHTFAFFKERSFDWIINTAAYTAVDQAESNPEGAEAGNVTIVKNLTDNIRDTGTKLIHISTDYVFDGSHSHPYTEEDPPNPKSVYGLTKWEGEKLALQYPYTMVIRTSWLYSSFGHNFLKSILKKARNGESLRVVNDQVGRPTYAMDLAGAISTVIERITNGIPFQPGIFHYANSGTCSWYEFAIAILSAAGLDVPVQPVSSKEYITAAERPRFSILSTAKMKTTFDLSIPHWRDGMMRCLKQLGQR